MVFCRSVDKIRLRRSLITILTIVAVDAATEVSKSVISLLRFPTNKCTIRTKGPKSEFAWTGNIQIVEKARVQFKAYREEIHLLASVKENFPRRMWSTWKTSNIASPSLLLLPGCWKSPRRKQEPWRFVVRLKKRSIARHRKKYPQGS